MQKTSTTTIQLAKCILLASFAVLGCSGEALTPSEGDSKGGASAATTGGNSSTSAGGNVAQGGSTITGVGGATTGNGGTTTGNGGASLGGQATGGASRGGSTTGGTRATGGASSIGGSVATGGTTATGGSGGSTNAAGTGGRGGASGPGGSGGKSQTCLDLEAQYARELPRFLVCSSGQLCDNRTSTAPGCVCQIPVQEPAPLALETLWNIEFAWFDAGCTVPVCPMPCATAARTACQGGRCVGLP